MRLFAGVATGDSSKEKSKEEEAAEATFRRDTILLYQNCLDGGASWTTLIRYTMSSSIQQALPLFKLTCVCVCPVESRYNYYLCIVCF